MRILPAAAAALLVTACQGSGGEPVTTPTFDAIGADETLNLTGTEPFWGATITGSGMVYSTPENQAGATLNVERFAGNNGVSYSGMLAGTKLDLVVTRATCSDGMSDRSYPFTATLRLGDEQRSGCGWTAAHPFSGPQNP